ncbi:MAG TPA: ATP-binding protein [Polyangiaceae bacterium]|nr:ATP-binding protein [Polyangiaceae bacterium]
MVKLTASGTSLSRHLRWDYVRRIALVIGLVLAYWFTFLPLFRVVDSAAFMVAVIPCLVSGGLLGITGGLATVLVTVLIDRQLALTVGIAAETGIPALVMTLITKLVLAIGAGIVAQSSRRLRAANAQMAREVSRRVRSEALLAARERRNAAVLEGLGEGVGLFDDADKCVYANPAWCKIFGKGNKEILGTSFSRYLDSSSQVQLAENRAERGANAGSYEVVLGTGEQRVLLVTESQLVGDASYRINRTLRVVRDVTDRIESERKQREFQQQLQRGQALQSLAVLAGGVAHDFNNLLSGVIGNAEFALRRVPNSAPRELTQCLEEIRGFANEATQLSRQMLAYAGRRSLSVMPIDTNLEVREALRLLHATIEAQAVLTLEMQEGLPTVKADRLQLRQVVTNLVLNALDAMAPERGQLSIRTRSLEMGSQELSLIVGSEELPAGTYVEIAVEDTGIGIPTELKDRIFEPFFSTKSPGRGMGLAASLGIVRAHHGAIDVSSEPGKGSTFRVLLPLAQEIGTPVRLFASSDQDPARAGCILLIDDEAAVRIATNRLLTDLGQRVMTADSGRRGLELFRQYHSSIDLVLLDLTMPELSGADVLDALREIRNDVAVVVTSGFHPSNAASLLNFPNVVGFLEKPHTLGNLQAMVNSQMGKPRSVRDSHAEVLPS